MRGRIWTLTKSPKMAYLSYPKEKGETCLLRRMRIVLNLPYMRRVNL